MLFANDCATKLSESTRAAVAAEAAPAGGEIFVAFHKPGVRGAFLWRIVENGRAVRWYGPTSSPPGVRWERLTANQPEGLLGRA